MEKKKIPPRTRIDHMQRNTISQKGVLKRYIQNISLIAVTFSFRPCLKALGEFSFSVNDDGTIANTKNW